MTRREAAEKGLKKYDTGRPCKHGHDSPRYVSTGICCRCNTINVGRYSKKFRSGLEPVTVDVHPDDKAAVEQMAAVLRAGRGLP